MGTTAHSIPKTISDEDLGRISHHLAGSFTRVDRHGVAELTVAAAELHALVSSLRGDLAFNMLLDIVGLDYLEYPGHAGERFAVLYQLKSLSGGKRLTLRIWLPEESPSVKSIHDLYKDANWLEREVYDQFGVHFNGHPNQKRILNHIQFVGHPLRKNYPITKRQWLTESDDLKDEMEKRLKLRGYT